MEHYGLGGYQLAVIQGGASDSLLALSSQLAQRAYSQESEHQKLSSSRLIMQRLPSSSMPIPDVRRWPKPSAPSWRYSSLLYAR